MSDYHKTDDSVIKISDIITKIDDTVIEISMTPRGEFHLVESCSHTGIKPVHAHSCIKLGLIRDPQKS